MTENLNSMSVDELIDEIISVSNSISNTSESVYLLELRAEIENRFRFMKEKVFRLGNIAHSAINYIGSANYEERVATARKWVDNILEAKKFSK